MKKILIIAPACDGEDVGEAWVAYQWASRLSHIYDVTLLTTYKRGHTPVSKQLTDVRVIEWQEPPGVGRFERLNSLLQPAYIPFYLRARRWIRQRLADGERFDVAHQVVPVAMRYPSPAADLGIPFIIGPVGGSLDSPTAFAAEEGAIPWYQRLRRIDAWRLRVDPLMRRTYQTADCVIGIADYVHDFLSPLRIRRLEVMSETAVDAAPERVDRSARSGPVRLLHVGRIVRTKGLRDVIRAVAMLPDLNIILDVVGDGNDRESCVALAAELGLAHRVAFYGTVPRAQVDDFYRAADVFVFPSYREPGGNVSLEAMSWGLPVIVCRRGGPGANVDESCAFLLEAESPSQLATDCAAAIRSLVADPEQRRRMGEAGRKRVLDHHLWPQRLGRMSQLYAEVALTRAGD
ncbi:glycosyltransferase family 4 protein [Microbacterium sp. zg-YB36]|uniref:glycosyltransferase family 4 protein n=1 Tax=Microbacterium sp. zg-YB36 TaxID=2969407 RepID=UPI00214C7CC8|nr:glycosyltransferase family 4 protein [Microbacterium sp. zg-YB36]MDL5352371.1 glycosyltransferase family 4 protein [Microbacterium sp. zg-YB36]